ncbi:hypothetical protein [Aestuariivivens marinum]|uniref:hypothetical protein n=1 Tax=Aestuariivivens marinum TaxID=2913555 RepID=UPI001F58CA5C|nr:hypothetical protein [Aestuariivivens marinum]
MKTARLYRFVLLFLVALLHFNVFGSTYFQEPQQIRSFDTNFKDRYSSRKYNYEGKKVINETPSGSGNYEDYKNENPNIRERDNSDTFSINLGPFSWLFYLALILALVYLVYILLNEGGTGLFSKGQNRKLNHHENITAKNIENTDIDALITHAENNNDFRLAIRYYYLLVLKTLSLKNHIKFEDDKTNGDYLNEISEKPFSNTFAYTSYLYSYIWYGKFPLDNVDYDKAKHNFVTLLNQVK